MAQSVEQLIRNQQVRGSNPLISSISSRTFTVRDDFLCGNFLPRSQILRFPARLIRFPRRPFLHVSSSHSGKTNLSFPMRRHLLSSYNQIFTPRFRALKISRSPAWLIRFPLSAVFACFTFVFRKTNLSFPICRHLLSSYNQILTPRFRSSQLRFNPCRLFTAYFVKYLALIGFPYPSAPTDAIYDRVCYSAVKITGLAFRVMSIIYTKAAARRNKSGGIIWKTKQNKASKNLSKRICL